LAKKKKETAPVTKQLVPDPVTGLGELDYREEFRMSSGASLRFVKGVYRRMFDDHSFLIVLYGAFSAGGLVGTEYNGIAIFWESRRVVLLLHHKRGPARMGQVSTAQQHEYARICAMDKGEFTQFINEHPEAAAKVFVTKPRPILQPRLGYQGVSFLKTRFATELDKRHFLEDLIKFLCNHCDPDRFTPRVYEGLHQHLGHIAHHDRRGFYEEWFADLSSRIRFLEHHAQGQVWGDWKDVDEAFKKWLNGVEGRAVLHHYRTELENKSEAAERQQLAKLKAKYEGGDGKAKEATA
jgi:hypothetical protein